MFPGIVSLALNLRIDRVYEKRMAWSNALKDADSDEFQQLSWEAVRAVSINFKLLKVSNTSRFTIFTKHTIFDVTKLNFLCSLTQRWE